MGVIAVLTAVLLGIIIAYSDLLFWNRTSSFQPKSLRGKSVIITGASSGLGAELARQYAKWGTQLLLTARNEESLRQVVNQCQNLGAARVEFLTGDMSDEYHRKQLVSVVEKQFGHLDHLVLNHATYSASHWLGTNDNLTTLDNIMQSNFLSHVDTVTKSLPLLTRSRGKVAVVSSLASKIPLPLMAGYSASKAAQQTFFSSLRQDLRRQKSPVSITTIVLGTVKTPHFSNVMKTTFHWINDLFAVNVQDAASAIIQHIDAGSGEIFYPFCAHFQAFFHLILPEIYEHQFHHLIH